MKSQRLRFVGGSGYELSGQLDRPTATPRAYALFAHCFTCNMNYKAMAHVSRALVDAGLAVLRFDFTGLGQSDGDFAETTFSSNVDDLVAAAAFLEQESEAPRLLLGHSLGGAAVLRAAPRIPAVRAVVTIAAPSDPEHLAGALAEQLENLPDDGDAEISVGGRTFRLKRAFLDDLAQHRLQEELPDLGRALLVLHSPADRTVGIDHAGALFRAARHPKSFVSLDQADHLLSDPADGRYAGQVAACWADRYLAAE